MEIALRIVAFMATSAVLNIPFGSWRNLTRKFSVAWFVSIHLPIPGIILMRKDIFGLDYWQVIPFSVAAAVAGQMVGKRLALFGYRAKEPVEADIASAQSEASAEVEST